MEVEDTVQSAMVGLRFQAASQSVRQAASAAATRAQGSLAVQAVQVRRCSSRSVRRKEEMKIDEPNIELRRIYMTIRDDTGVLSTTAASSPPAGAVQVSQNGAAFVNAGGTLVHMGGGSYYYEASLLEAHTPGFLAVKYERAGFATEIDWTPVGQIFKTGETDATLLRLPLTIYDTNGNLATTATAVSPDLQVSANGAAYTTSTGSLVPVGSGLYYYQGVAADAVTAGAVILQYTHAGFGTAVVWQGVEGVSASTGSLVSLTPADGSLLSPDPRIARFTPIVGVVQCSAGHVPYVFAKIGSLPWTVYDGSRSQMMPLFGDHSKVVNLPNNTFEITILPNGGWWRSNIDIRFVSGGELT